MKGANAMPAPLLDRARGGPVLPATLGVKPRPVGIVTLTNRILGPAAQMFIDEARVVAKALDRTG